MPTPNKAASNVQIQAVVFDFDGTLVDSNQVKVESFFTAIEGCPDATPHMRQLLSQPKFGTRYEVFDWVAAQTFPDASQDEQMAYAKAWVEHYGRRCYAGVLAAPAISGAEACLQQLQAAGVALFVNSATPEIDLLPVVEGRGMTAYFQGVFGAPISKLNHLERIAQTNGFLASEILMVGDGDNDQAAALAFGCAFHRVRPEKPGLGDMVRRVLG